MSTTAAPIPIDVTATEHVPMSRLAAVEFRKALDTRAGRWFAGSIVGAGPPRADHLRPRRGGQRKNYEDFLSIAGFVLGYFLPILIIMLVTSESSQRNGLVTFALEPRRSRIVVAKLLAGLLLAACVMVLAALMAVIATLFGSLTGGTPEWGVDGNLLFNGFVLANVIGVLVGFAIATLLMNTPARSSPTSSTPSSCRRPSASSARSARASRRWRRGSTSTPRSCRCSRATTCPTARSGRSSR